MRRSKQKGGIGASPRLGPNSPGNARRGRSSSVTSEPSPLISPLMAGHTNATASSSTGMTPLLSNLAVGASPPDMSLDGPAAPEQSQSQVTYTTSFRNDQHGGAPTTGLGYLISANSSSAATTTALHHQHHGMRQYTPEQRAQMQKDAQDRDRQARALAAAGMAAEQMKGSGLHPPPTLGSTSYQQQHSSMAAHHVPIDTHSGLRQDEWINLDQQHHDNNGLTMEEMDVDFAKLFDPNEEVANMHTHGSGWPMSADAPTTSILMSDNKYLTGSGGKLEGEI